MAVVDVVNIGGDVVSQTELKDSIFNVPVKKSVLHQVVIAQLAAKRAGSASVRHRSDVKGSRHFTVKKERDGQERATSSLRSYVAVDRFLDRIHGITRKRCLKKFEKWR